MKRAAALAILLVACSPEPPPQERQLAAYPRVLGIDHLPLPGLDDQLWIIDTEIIDRLTNTPIAQRCIIFRSSISCPSEITP